MYHSHSMNNTSLYRYGNLKWKFISFCRIMGPFDLVNNHQQSSSERRKSKFTIGFGTQTRLYTLVPLFKGNKQQTSNQQSTNQNYFNYYFFSSIASPYQEFNQIHINCIMLVGRYHHLHRRNFQGMGQRH